MLHAFLKSPLPNALAIAVLIALIYSWFTALLRGLGDKHLETERGGYAVLLPLFSLLAIPAAIDLLQTSGVTILYAGLLIVVLLLNIAIPLAKMAWSPSQPLVKDWYRWSILFSALAGIAVSGYLALVETAGAQVSCGPAGGCQAVQNSPYARLFGVLPIADIGLAGFVAILFAWIAWQFGNDWMKRYAPVAIWAMSLFGALFSAYLTFLEPFVIGATCMWCLSTAVLMISMLLLSTPSAQRVAGVPSEDD